MRDGPGQKGRPPATNGKPSWKISDLNATQSVFDSTATGPRIAGGEPL